MAIKMYVVDSKKYYEVYINGRDCGNRFQKRRKGIESLPKAKQVEFEFLQELARIKDSKANYTWDQWLQVCLSRMKLGFMPSTVRNYETTLNKWVTPQWKGVSLSEINREWVYKVIFENVDQALKPNSRKCILKFVKRIFQMAIEEAILDKNPCVGIKIRIPEIEQKVLTTKEVELFLSEAKAINHRFYPVWVMAVMTGMRSGELFALKWTDIDFETKLISVNKQWTSKNGYCPTKTRRNRVVPISDELLLFLKNYKIKMGNDSEHVLPRLSEWMHGDQAKVTKAFCHGIGITPIKFHDLRATFITNLLARGESLARVMSMVGHTELKTTNTYLRKAGVDVQGGTDRLAYKVPRDNEGKVISFGSK